MDKGLSEASFEEMIARAEAAVISLKGLYRDQLKEDVLALAEIWDRFERGVEPSEVIADIHAIAHNVKGQGGSFGYELVTEIGASLCNFIRSARRRSRADFAVLKAHIGALKEVSDCDISGMGGEAGERIVAELKALTT